MNTEERIVEAAGELFFRNGIKSITMDDIAEQLGISKKTIYQFYPDKSAIVCKLTDKELELQLKEMMEARASAVNAIDEIFKTMSCLSRTFTKINANVFYDMQKFHPEAWNRFRDFKEKKILSFVQENLKNGIEQELYRKNLNIKIISKFRLEQVELAFNPSAFPPDKFNVRDVQLVLLSHFVYGIATLKGHKLIDKYEKEQSEL